MESDSQYYIDKGFIDVSDNAEFRIIVDAANCFGKNYKGLQRSYFRHPKEPKKRLWFPKLYKNDEWNNQISSDEETIISCSESPIKNRTEVDKIISQKNDSVIVFIKVKSSNRDTKYCFKGEYKLDKESSNHGIGCVYRRIGTRVKTYPNK